MKAFIILSIASLSLFGCNGGESKEASEESTVETTVIVEETTTNNDSITTTELEERAESIESASDSLDILLNKLN